MPRRAVEKPRWRQPVHTGSQISDLTSRMQMSLVIILFLGLTGWAQAGSEPAAPIGAPKLITAGRGYRLHQGDKIEARFFYQPELNHEAVVKPDGMVTLQLIGDVRAEGLTPRQLEHLLTNRYTEFLVDPVVSIILKEFVKPRVFIGGQVIKPGPYELRDGDTLAQALILAGGFTDKAHRKSVLHARPMGEGQMRVTVIDTTKLYTESPDPDLNLTLRAGDLIFVPDSKLSRVKHFLESIQVSSFAFILDSLNRR